MKLNELKFNEVIKRINDKYESTYRIKNVYHGQLFEDGIAAFAVATDGCGYCRVYTHEIDQWEIVK